ncbi:molybdopterin-binding protein [Mucilaginibacter terrenus]|uniref:Molybdopterin-binding protein n=1 Tax=Mucilaginibacter terrenus TaxID=2482727 RepID=A0A3E2NPK5_9SPHI|nr:molybdopterin-binding protein [Mucilaginibacter terrenus]RFZ82929.1 molybdopterin-binding protein [Mucilaginibacter terrenus]
MRNILFILFLAVALNATAQDTATKQTLQFTITGGVEKESLITPDSLKQYKTVVIGDIKVTDHTGAFKHKDDDLKGVLLKDILSHTKYKTSSPKLLSRFYFVCTGADGYKVVYSWNELYNTTVGDKVFIITEKNGKGINELPESIQMTSASDFKTGRRYLHNLLKIAVEEVQ